MGYLLRPTCGNLKMSTYWTMSCLWAGTAVPFYSLCSGICMVLHRVGGLQTPEVASHFLLPSSVLGVWGRCVSWGPPWFALHSPLEKEKAVSGVVPHEGLRVTQRTRETITQHRVLRVQLEGDGAEGQVDGVHALLLKL